MDCTCTFNEVLTEFARLTVLETDMENRLRVVMDCNNLHCSGCHGAIMLTLHAAGLVP